MPSFDIVSEVEMTEVRNAAENSSRELETRFDFRGVEASFEYKQEEIKVSAEADFQLKQMLDILRSNLVKRKVDTAAMEVSDPVHSGKTFYLHAKFQQGIEQSTAKKIVKAIKEKKLKVQAAIQGEQVRVTGKKRDDLQAVMAMCREGDFEQPLQFTNFRD